MDKSLKNFIIAEFKEGMDMCPKTWLKEGCKEALWPNNIKGPTQFYRRVKKMEKPEMSWETVAITKILKQSGKL